MLRGEICILLWITIRIKVSSVVSWLFRWFSSQRNRFVQSVWRLTAQFVSVITPAGRLGSFVKIKILLLLYQCDINNNIIFHNNNTNTGVITDSSVNTYTGWKKSIENKENLTKTNTITFSFYSSIASD